jgi:ATP-dependent DNA helicase DinG
VPVLVGLFRGEGATGAQEADLVVVNHHLLFADLALKREGFGEILPGAHAFVLDEAHQLPELASQFFGMTASARQLQELARDAIAECDSVSGALGELQEPVRQLEQRVRELRLALDPLPRARHAARLVERCLPRWPMPQRMQDGLEPLREAARFDAVLEVQGERPVSAACAAAWSEAEERRQDRLRADRQLEAVMLADETEPDPVSVHWYETHAARFPAAAHAAGRLRAAARASRAIARGVDLHLGDAGGGPGVSTILPTRLGASMRRARCSSPARSIGPPGAVLPAAAACPSRMSRDYIDRT